MLPDRLDIYELESVVAVASAPVGLASYDFDHRAYFSCRSAVYGSSLPLVLRVGAMDDYAAIATELVGLGFALVNSERQHHMASNIVAWEPVLRGLTPETVVLDALPAEPEVADRLGWPLFIKGERQTSLHRAELSIARNPQEYARIRAAWTEDRILRWQRPAIRRFVPLRRVGDHARGLQASFEFRVFCWYGQPVSVGRYWTDHAYSADDAELEAILSLARRAAELVAVPFLVVDVAQTADREWIVIECNDAQESSYAANPPISLWSGIIDAERARTGASPASASSPSRSRRWCKV